MNNKALLLFFTLSISSDIHPLFARLNRLFKESESLEEFIKKSKSIELSKITKLEKETKTIFLTSYYNACTNSIQKKAPSVEKKLTRFLSSMKLESECSVSLRKLIKEEESKRKEEENKRKQEQIDEETPVTPKLEKKQCISKGNMEPTDPPEIHMETSEPATTHFAEKKHSLVNLEQPFIQKQRSLKQVFLNILNPANNKSKPLVLSSVQSEARTTSNHLLKKTNSKTDKTETQIDSRKKTPAVQLKTLPSKTQSEVKSNSEQTLETESQIHSKENTLKQITSNTTKSKSLSSLKTQSKAQASSEQTLETESQIHSKENTLKQTTFNTTTPAVQLKPLSSLKTQSKAQANSEQINNTKSQIHSKQNTLKQTTSNTTTPAVQLKTLSSLKTQSEVQSNSEQTNNTDQAKKNNFGQTLKTAHLKIDKTKAQPETSPSQNQDKAQSNFGQTLKPKVQPESLEKEILSPTTPQENTSKKPSPKKVSFRMPDETDVNSDEKTSIQHDEKTNTQSTEKTDKKEDTINEKSFGFIKNSNLTFNYILYDKKNFEAGLSLLSNNKCLLSIGMHINFKTNYIDIAFQGIAFTYNLKINLLIIAFIKFKIKNMKNVQPLIVITHNNIGLGFSISNKKTESIYNLNALG